MTFDITKPVQTRDGRPARILDPDWNGSRLLVAITNHMGTSMQSDFVIYYNKDGTHRSHESYKHLDLINAPEPLVEQWLWEDLKGVRAPCLDEARARCQVKCHGGRAILMREVREDDPQA